jgi:hypothetical protein
VRCYGFCYFVSRSPRICLMRGHEYASGSLPVPPPSPPPRSAQPSFQTQRHYFNTRIAHAVGQASPTCVFRRQAWHHHLERRGIGAQTLFDSGFPHGKRDGIYDSTIKDTRDDVFGAPFVADDRGDRVRRCELHLLRYHRRARRAHRENFRERKANC